MDRCDDLVAALLQCLQDPSSHFNVYTVLAVAQQLGEQRRSIQAPRS